MHHKDNVLILTFESDRDFEAWLSENHSSVDAIWLRFYKKGTGHDTFTYAEALDVALCYGWIDGIKNKFDENSYILRFTPRRKNSIWSKVNIGKVAKLIENGRMQPQGLAEVDRAKADGRWDQAYDSPANMEIPEDFLQELSKFPEALAFFNTLNKTNRYSIGWRLQTAKKPETRANRMSVIIGMMKEGKKFH